ncbi:MAG: glycosyltransferase family 2 protein [Candidatus Nealsonbacteria bacterium]
MVQPKVSIIVLTWNNYQDTKECLASLKNLNYDNYSVVLVDNGSTDDSFERLKNEFQHSKFIFIKNKKNLGYAGGTNVGIKYSLEKLNPDFVWILNNDIVVASDSLKILVETLNKNSDVGVAGSTICWSGTKEIMEQYYYLNLWLGRFLVKTNLDENEIIKIKNKKGKYIGGAAVFLRKEALEEIGLIPEEYFMYDEDASWQENLRKTSWQLMYVGPAKVWHKKSVSSGGKKTIMPDYYDSRNFLYFIKRFYPLWLPYEMSMSVINKMIPKILRGEWLRLKYVILGLKDFLKGKMGKI